MLAYGRTRRLKKSEKIKEQSPRETTENKPFKEFNDFSKSSVNPEFWTISECLLAQRTLRLVLRIPEAFDAAQAEVVSTGNGDGVGVEVQTDAASELVFS